MAATQFQPNHILFQESDVGDVAYYVVSGKIEISQSAQGGNTRNRFVEAGGLVGEQAVFEVDSPRPYTARVVEPTEVISVTLEEMQNVISAQSAPIQALLKTAYDKMKQGRGRTTHVSAATAASSGEIKKLTIKPVGKKMEAQFTAHEVTLNKLPYKIGGYPEDGKVNRRDGLHLAIAAEVNPLRVSRQHCEINLEEDKLMLVDVGSRFCTTVNGVIVGRGRGIYSAQLIKGENSITLGSAENEYTLTVTCE